MAIVGLDDLPGIHAAHPGESITFCSGSFDLFHIGHVVFLEWAKREFPGLLVVGVGNDSVIRAVKGEGRPVVDQVARLRLVDSQRSVDYCYLDTISRSKEDLAEVLEQAFSRLKPRHYVINNNAFDIETRHALCNKHGARMEVGNKYSYAGQFSGVSTSAIVKAIKEGKSL